MKLCALGLALTFAGVVATSCVPLTFSHDEAIDFETYRTAYLQVSVIDAAVFYGAENARQYLLGELRKGSGFEAVFVDPNQSVDVNLNVRLSLVERVQSSDDGLEFEYDSTARYTVVDSAGRTIDSGSVADSGSFPGEAVEDALDEIALHFLKPYRL